MKIIVFRIVSGLLFLISLLPFRILYLISDLLFLILYHLVGYRRKVVFNNLQNSFPEKSIAEIKTIEKRYYHYLADLIIESVKSFTISSEEIKKRFIFKNLSAITSYLEAGRSVIAVSGHYGNWEWASIAIAQQLQEDVLIVYKPLSNKRFEKLINAMRSKFGAILVPMKYTLRKLVEYKNKPYVLALIGDQTPPKEESNYFTNFLNQPTAIFLGVEKIALKYNNPIIYFNIKRIKRGYYECLIEPIVENPGLTRDFEITNLHTKELEKNIRLAPEFWLWSHKRWKFSPADLKQKQ
ncbi:MAG: lysophospholipid acyltransferase family protein [Pedobacter sp.]|jgi:KDO2-lipid IV(A) lauroyltransferase